MSTTISDSYRAEQQKLHRNPRYGVASRGYAPLVRDLLRIGGCDSIADYGAGKCNLKHALGLRDGGRIDYRPYDPAFPDYGPARAADLVTCIDVLEHVEPELLDTLLDELSGLPKKLMLLTVHTGPAKKTLSDGRNAHITQQPPSWWLERFAPRMDVLHVQSVKKGFFAVAAPKGRYRDIAASIDLEALSLAAGRARPRRKTLGGIVRKLLGRA